LSSYNQQPEPIQDDLGDAQEYIAYHRHHEHEMMKTGKDAGGNVHVSVANRLTVSRFRNLMSSAAGQKFLNENLHRTAVLASHIPSMQHRSNAQKSLTQGGGQGGSGGGQGSMTESSGIGQKEPPQLPTFFPLYVRIRAQVGDWGIPKEKRQDFLVLGPSNATASIDDEQSEWKQTRRAGGDGDGNVVGVLEHILREIMAEAEFGNIIDNMVMEQTPVFAQYEDSVPPGEPPAPTLRFPDSGSSEEDVSGADLLKDLLGGGEAVSNSFLLGATNPGAYQSDLLLDFPGAPGLGTSVGSDMLGDHPVVGSSSSSSSKAPGAAASYRSSPVAVSAPASCANSSAAPEADAAEDGPQRFWDEALRDYGEVDLESFKAGAGEVLDKLLLDMMDDVVAGRLNWMRPMPKPRPRR